MISYDAYKNRIQRIAAVKRFIFRFKVPIIVVLSLIVAATTAFLCTKGTITSNVAVVTENIVYGEDFELKDAKALFSKVKAYEYRKEGTDDWTTEKPTQAGKYSVRAVTSGGFGRKRGEEVTFEIKPLAALLTVVSEEVEYGSNPREISVQLSGSDRVIEDGIVYKYGSYVSEHTYIEADLSTVKILNAKGEDVTGSYTLSTSRSDIKWLPKNLTLVPKTVTKEYNGAPQPFENVVSDSTLTALGGDRAEFATRIYDEYGYEIYAPENAGRYTVAIDPDSVRIYKGSTDVTERYDLSENSFAPHSFTVNKRSITVSTADATKEYDGTPLIKEDGYFADNLANGHTLAIEGGEVVQITNVGFAGNAYTFRVLGDGEDVTANYDIRYNYGTLAVNPRSVTVTAGSGTFEYNGKNRSVTDVEKVEKSDGGQGFVTGEYIALKSGVTPVAIRNVGTVKNVFETSDFKVYDAFGNESQNYVITDVIYGTINVTPRNIALTAESLSEVYDGTDKYRAETDMSEHVLLGAYDTTPPDEIFGLCYGHTARVTDENRIIKARNVGQIANNYIPEYYRIFDAVGEDVTANYNIVTVTPGQLEITLRTVNVTTDSSSWTYDGVEHFNSEYGTIYDMVTSFPVAEHHTLTLVNTTRVKHVVTREYNLFESYVVTDESGEDVSDNYNVVRYSNGWLTITACPVTVNTESDKREYNGEELSLPRFGATSVPDGHTVAADTATVPGITNAGSVPNNFEVRITDATGADVTSDFEPTYNYGTLTVTPRTITVTTASDEKMYDGSYLSNYGFEYSDAIADKMGDEIVLNNARMPEFASILRKGSTGNTLYCKAVNSLGEDTDNYKIQYNYGTLTITARPVKITTDGGTRTYNAEEFSVESATVSKEGLAGGDSLRVIASTVTKVTNVTAESGVSNETKFDIYDYTGERVTDCYDIEYGYGKLIITARKLKIATRDDSREYDGTAFSSYEPRSVSSVEGYPESGLLWPVHNVTHDTNNTASITEVGSTENVVKYFINDSSKTDVTANYDIEYEYGTLTVTKRKVMIQTDSASKVYDGTPLFTEEAQVHLLSSPGPRNDGLVTGHSLTAITPRVSLTDVLYREDGKSVDSIPNIYEYDIYDGSGNRVTDYYDIVYEYQAGEMKYTYGTLTVIYRSIIVKTGSRDWEYDGTTHSYAEATTVPDEDNCIYDLAEGHEFVLTNAVTITNVRRADDYSVIGIDNTMDIDVTDGNGKSVLKNYAVLQVNHGTVTVTPREIGITSESAEKVFDGKELSCPEIESIVHITSSGREDALISDHKAEIAVYAKITHVWESDLNYIICNITDSNNESRLANYSVIYEFGTLTIKPRPMTITTATNSWVYDDEYHSDPTEEISEFSEERNEGLLPEHKISRPVIPLIRNVGESTNELVYEIFTEDYIPVINDYAITYVYGTLTVTPRPVTIVTRTLSKEYDGKALYAELDGKATSEHAYNAGEYTGLVDGHYLSVNVAFASITNVGKVEDTTESLILVDRDGNTDDVTGNYEISYEHGTLTVTERNIGIQVQSKEWEYDGEVHSWDKGDPYHLIKDEEKDATYRRDSDPDAVILADGHFLVATTEKVGITNVWESSEYTGLKNLYQYRVVCIATDGVWDSDKIGTWYDQEIGLIDVTANYNIIAVNPGILTITPRKITVTREDAEKVYDGDPLYGDKAAADRLVSGHKLVVDGERTSITNYWERGKLIETQFTVADLYDNLTFGEHALAENYEISYTYGVGRLNIWTRNITVQTGSAQKVYDGTPLECADFAVLESSPHDLLPGHYLTLDKNSSGTAKKTDAGSISNIRYYIVESAENNVIDGHTIDENYSIKHEFGTLTVLRRNITVVTGSDEREYNGEPLTCYEFGLTEYSEYGLVEDHVLILDNALKGEFGKITNVGTASNRLHFVICDRFVANKDYTSNYNINLEEGTLTVTPRTVYVKAVDETAEYSGTEYLGSGDYEYYGESVTDENRRFVVGEDLILHGYKGPLDNALSALYVGKHGAYINTAVCDISGGLRSNYNIICNEAAIFEILPRPVKITAPWFSAEYNGIGVSADSQPLGSEYAYDTAFAGFVNSDATLINVEYEYFDVDGNSIVGLPVNVGEYIIRIASYDGNILENYYIVGKYEGRLNITKRSITVRPVYGEKVYDGKEVYYGDWTDIGGRTYQITQGSLMDGDELSLSATFSGIVYTDSKTILVSNDECVTEAGQYVVSFNRQHAQLNNPDYNIEFENGEYVITPRTVHVENSSLTETYTGKPVYAPTIVPTENMPYEDRMFVESLGHRIELDGAYWQTDAGTYVNTQSVSIYFGDDNVTHNYNISLTHGTLVINPRELTVVLDLPSFVKEYDAQPFAFDGGYTVKGLADEHAVDFTQVQWTTLTDADTYDVYVIERLRIVDGYGNKIKDYNYTIAGYENRNPVTITPKELWVNLNLGGREYNGAEQPLELGEVLIGSGSSVPAANVVTGFYLGVYNESGEASALKNAGSYTARTAEIVLDGIANNPNYVIYGSEEFTVEIDKYDLLREDRMITVVTASDSKAYDGRPLSAPRMENQRPAPDFPQLHVFAVVYSANYPSVTLPDEKTENVLEVYIYSYVTDSDESGNFNLAEFLAAGRLEYGTLEIDPNVKLDLADESKSVAYNGTSYETGGEQLFGKVKNMSGRENKYISFGGTVRTILHLTDAGWVKVNEVKDAGDYRIYYNDIVFTDGGKPISDDAAEKIVIKNTLDIESGCYIAEKHVNKKLLYVKPQEKTETYTGTDILQADREAVAFNGTSLASGHSYIIDEFDNILDAKQSNSVYVTIVSGHVEDEFGRDVTHNYDVFSKYADDTSIKSNQYRAKIKFNKVTVYITPIAPEQKVYAYCGETYKLPETPDYIFDGSQLLKESQYIKVSASVTKSLGTKLNWFDATVYCTEDGKEYSMSSVYSVVALYSDDAVLEVAEADVNVVYGNGSINVTIQRPYGIETLEPVNIPEEGSYEYKLTASYNMLVTVAGNTAVYKVFKPTSKTKPAIEGYFNVNLVYNEPDGGI